MLKTIGKVAMHTTMTLGAAWLASIVYCKTSAFMKDNTTNQDSYKITKTGLGASMLVGATIGLGSSIIFISDSLIPKNVNNLYASKEVIERCSGD